MAFEGKIRELIAEQLGIPEEEIQEDSSFSGDLGADTLDVLEVILAMEEEFEIEIPDNEAEHLTTFAKLVQYLESRIN